MLPVVPRRIYLRYVCAGEQATHGILHNNIDYTQY